MDTNKTSPYEVSQNTEGFLKVYVLDQNFESLRNTSRLIPKIGVKKGKKSPSLIPSFVNLTLGSPSQFRSREELRGSDHAKTVRHVGGTEEGQLRRKV